MFERLEKILDELDEAVDIYESDLPNELKYGLLQAHQLDILSPALIDVGIIFEWPNAHDYSIEMKRYILSVKIMKRNLSIAVSRRGAPGFRHE